MEDIWEDLTTLPSDSAATSAAPAAASPSFSSLGHQDQFRLAVPNWSKNNPQNDDDGDRTIKVTLSNRASEDDKTQTPFSLKIGTCSKRKRPSGSEPDALERKRKRLMKNRESAVRSRARREAYTYHLEAKISLLKEENAELKKQQEKCHQQVEEHKLQRTLTAPF